MRGEVAALGMFRRRSGGVRAGEIRSLLEGAGLAAAGLILAGLATPAFSQNTTTSTAKPTVTTGQPSETSFGPEAAATIKKLIADGYEIKTGFIDPNVVAYLALQKATSAFLCHSNPNPTCEKLN